MLIRKRKGFWTKPKGRLHLNLDHRLTAGLKSACFLSDGSGEPVDLITKNTFAWTNQGAEADWTDLPYKTMGSCFNASPVSQATGLAQANFPHITNAITSVASVYCLDLSAGIYDIICSKGGVYSAGSPNTTFAMAVAAIGSGPAKPTRLTMWMNDAGSAGDREFTCQYPTSIVNNWNTLGCIIPPGASPTFEGFQNGIQLTDIQHSNGEKPLPSTDPGYPLRIGYPTTSGFGEYCFRGYVDWNLVYDRALSADDMRWLHEYPYDIVFAQPQRSYFIFGTASAPPVVLNPYAPGLVKAPAKLLSSWRVDKVTAGSMAVLGLKELRVGQNAVLPNKVYSTDDYPNADNDIIGTEIAIFTGPVRGMRAYKINTLTHTFKYAENPSLTIQAIKDKDGADITVTSTDLANSEITWTGHTDEEIYVSATALYPNPVDAMKFYYTDTDYGASIPLAKLDTTSTGKGYGATGARVDFIEGHSADGTEEFNNISLGVYVNKTKALSEWIKLIKNAAMLTAYTDRSGLYQVKPFNPATAEGLPEITLDHILSSVDPQIDTSEAKTRCRVFYNKDHRSGAEIPYEYESDELLQKRDFDDHALREIHLPISNKDGAIIRAQREVVFNGAPRWTLDIKVVEKFSELEPGDYVKLNYQPEDENGNPKGLGIKTVCEVIEAEHAGGIEVDLLLRDVRGLRRRPGWYVEDSPSFPARLGGSAITTWDDTWTDPQKEYVLENLAFYHDDNGYCETNLATDDPLWSYNANVYL